LLSTQSGANNNQNIQLSSHTLTVDGTGNTTVNNRFMQGTAATAVIKKGAGILTFNINDGTGAGATATFEGDVQINGGSVRYGRADALPSTADVIFNSASGTSTLDLNGLNGTIASLTLGGASATTAAVTTGAGTLTLGGNVTYNATNNPNGATISGLLDLGAANRTFNIGDSSAAADDVLVSAPISGTSVGLIKEGSGKLKLTALNSYTGATSVNAGTLTLDYTSNTSKIADAGVLVLGGGTLELSGGSHTEIVASTTLTAGTASNVTRSSGTSVLQMGAITREAGATINFEADGIATTDTLNTNGILGTWATVGGIYLATRDIDGTIIAFTGYLDVPRRTPGTIADAAVSNVRLIEGAGTLGNITLGSAVTTINSLNQSDEGGTSAATIDPATQTLRVETILVGPTAGALTIGTGVDNGTLTTATAGGTLQLINNAGMTVNSVIADNTSATGLNKAGSGSLTLTAANTYSGVTTLSGGTLNANSTDALGDGSATNTLIFDGGALQAAGTITSPSTRGVTFASTGVIDTNGNAVSIPAITSGIGGLTKNGAGTLSFSNFNTFTGPLTINGGTVEFSTPGFDYNTDVFKSTQININNGSSLRINSSVYGDVIPMFDGRTYTFDSNGGGSILLGTGNHNAEAAPFTIRSLGGAQNTIGLITTSDANGFNLGNTTATFDIALGSHATSDLVITPIVSNNGSILKTGTGRLALSGANTYLGTTTVSAGTLLVNGNQAAASGAVSVNGTSTLGGTGTVGGAVTVAAGATIAPGVSVGTLTVDDNVTLGGTYACQVNGMGKDVLAVVGNLNVTGATLAVSEIGAGATESSYVIATYTGTLTGTFAVSPALPAGYSVDYTTSGQIKLVSGGSPFEDWAALKGLTGDPGFENGPNDDPDNDGRNNLAEFAFNGDPLSGSDNGMIAGLVQDASAPAGDEMTLVVAVRDDADFDTAGSLGMEVQTATIDGVTYTIEGTLDLVTIPGSDVSHAAGPSDTAPAATGLPSLAGTDWEYHTFKLDASEGLGDKGFLRAKVTSP
jgi:autotransporter-associated beta strand protein